MGFRLLVMSLKGIFATPYMATRNTMDSVKPSGLEAANSRMM
jgi:hypothetical protein